MRRLAFFSFSFAAGVLLGLLKAPRWVLYVLPALAVLLVAAAVLLRGRKEQSIAICAAGLALGLVHCTLYEKAELLPLRTVAADRCAVALDLTGYPEPKEYGSTAEAVLLVDGKRIPAFAYLGTYDESWRPGDRLTGTGSIELETGKGAPVLRWYGRANGRPVRVKLFRYIETKSADAVPLRYGPAVLAHGLRGAIRALLPADISAYLEALLIGDKSGLSYQQKSDLQIAGVYHAMAVSGMHVSILMTMLGVLLLRNQRLYPLIGIPVLVFYCVMTGARPSAIRAAIMQAFLLMAPLLRREPDPPTSLGAALLTLTVHNPWCLADIGLQLSFLATAGILAFQPKLYGWFTARTPRRFRRLRDLLAGTTACTLSALSLTLPLTVLYFGTVSMLAVLSNLLLLPAITWTFYLGLPACLIGLKLPAVGRVLAAPVTLLLRYTAYLARGLARLPFAAVYPDTVYPVVWLVFFYGAALWLLLHRRRPGRARMLTVFGCSAILLCAALLLAWQDAGGRTFAFTALDVGQGQCLYCRSGAQNAAVDCGGSKGDDAGETLARRILSGGRTHLDCLILTHYDEDHTGGVRQLLYRIRVDHLLLPDRPDDSGTRAELEALAAEYGVSVTYVTGDLTLPFGAGTLSVFAPVTPEAGNDGSLSVLASFGDFDILTTGDMGQRAERLLLTLHPIPDLEVLVAGHHGSKSSTGEYLLRETAPELVVISVGENSYGHPAGDVLARIAASGAAALRTDEQGTITVRR